MMRLWQRIKKAFNDFLEKLARDNEKAFGSGKLDCCQLNQNEQRNKSR